MRKKKLKVKSTAGATKDSKNRPPEIVLKQGCGEFLLGKDIRTLLHLPHTKSRDSGKNCYTYEFVDSGINVWVENNIITEVVFQFGTPCWYKGYNLAGMNYKDFLSIIGSLPKREYLTYLKKGYKKNGENQHVYDFDKEGLLVWVWRGKIDTIVLSDYDRVKSTVGTTKDSKNRPPEIVLKQGCGEFLLGKNIRKFLHLTHTKTPLSGGNCYSYEFLDSGINVWVENNIITEIVFQFGTPCWYKGYNLVGMNYKDFLSIIGSLPKREYLTYLKKGYKKNGENQHAYQFVKEGLLVWVWRGKIDTILLTDYDRDFV